MAKIKYTATCADGTVVTRKSDRTYTHYWVVTAAYTRTYIDLGRDVNQVEGERTIVGNGWGGTRELAQKAATTRANQCCKVHKYSDAYFTNPQIEIVAGVAS